MDIFGVNGIDFSEYIVQGGIDVSRNDLHSSDSGRNALTGKMFFRIVTTKYNVDLAVVDYAPQEWVKSLVAEISKNGRVNQYSVYIPHISDTYVFTGYINQLKIGVFNFYYDLNNQLGANLKSFPINIIEV